MTNDLSRKRNLLHRAILRDASHIDGTAITESECAGIDIVGEIRPA